MLQRAGLRGTSREANPRATRRGTTSSGHEQRPIQHQAVTGSCASRSDMGPIFPLSIASGVFFSFVLVLSRSAFRPLGKRGYDHVLYQHQHQQHQHYHQPQIQIYLCPTHSQFGPSSVPFRDDGSLVGVIHYARSPDAPRPFPTGRAHRPTSAAHVYQKGQTSLCFETCSLQLHIPMQSEVRCVEYRKEEKRKKKRQAEQLSAPRTADKKSKMNRT